MSTVDALKQSYIKVNYEQCMTSLMQYKSVADKSNRPKELADYIPYIQKLEAVYKKLESFKLVMDASQLKPLLESTFDKAIEDWQKKEYEINTKYEDMLDHRVHDLEDEAKEQNKVKIREFNESNQIYIDLENKRKQLESYADEIIDICTEYGITTADVDIDNSSFTVSELGEIYDKYLDFIQHKTSRMNPISVFRDKIPNVYTQFCVLAFILVLSWSAILDVLAICFYAVLIKSQIVQKSKAKSFIVLYGLVFNVHPMEMGFKDEINKDELVSEEINEDEDIRLGDVTEEWSKELEELDKKNPANLMEDAKAEFASRMNEIQKEFNDLVKKFEHEKGLILDAIKIEIRESTAEFEDRKSRVLLLGQEVSTSAVFNTKFRLGLHNEVMEETVEIGLRNVIIRPSKDFEMHRKFLQVMLANAMCNVRINLLSVIICDPNRQGQELVSFYDPDLEDLIQFTDEPLEDIVKNLKKFADKNLKQMKGMDIIAFNKQAEELDRTPREYKLLIVLSQPKKVEEDEALSEFMSYSAEFGVFVWLVSNKNLPKTFVFSKPFDGVQHPYPVREGEFGMKVAKTLVETRKKNKEKALTWNRFCSVAAKDEQIWTKVADDKVEIMPGFYEGDPDQFSGYTFGNQGNVHMIGVGGTGAGKSVFLNFVVCELTKLYSPRDLELWMIDFKGNEFIKYLPKPGHPAILPHIKACLCTSDGDYAGSLFHALRKLCEDRFALFQGEVKNLKQWNERARAKGDLDEVLPRVLCINDEFQVIFEKAEPKVVEQIKQDITFIAKLGRACGVHLFFTSQSMKGTMSDDILDQFTLRFALRCSQDVSMQILGTKYASEIKQANGYLYVRSQEDKSLQAQKRYKTPYICDEGPDEKHPDRVDELQAHIDLMAALAKEKGFKPKDVITYLESTVHDIGEIDKFYEVNRDKIESGFFLLGERMVYSSNRAPENFNLTAENNTHIFSAFSDTKDLVNFYKTIMRNIKLANDGSSVLINSQVKDLHYLCEIDKELDGVQLTLSTEKVDVYDLLNTVYQPVYDARVAAGTKEKPVYIILLGWDKARGFGIDKDYNEMGRFTTFMQLCGEYNIHFIFICSGTGQISPGLIEACKYRIAGKLSESDGYKVVDSKLPSKNYEGMKNGYMFIYRGGEVSRAKIYQSPQEREIKSAELVL